MAGGEAPAKKSDLGVRVVSAVVIVAVAGTALWLGGWVWAAFVALVAIGVLYEWRELVRAMQVGSVAELLWTAAGVVYVGMGATTLHLVREQPDGFGTSLLLIGAVAAIDIGAYFFGRSIGGPKIAPKISPSKTWAGLFGGMVAAFTVLFAGAVWGIREVGEQDLVASLKSVLPIIGIVAVLFAVIAQAGDFFESWMKRRAGVKDSGTLLPGHGGLFDRVDGLMAVLFVTGLIRIVASA